jgi:NACalpha-BTF3-like transcription factor
MSLLDKILQKRIQKKMKDMGLDHAQLNVDISGITAADMIKMEKKFKEFVSKHPTLQKLQLDNLPALLKHKDELKELFEENKEEIQGLLSEIQKDKK